MNPEPDENPTATLSPADARLLDLLIEQGPAALPTGNLRAERLLAAWRLLEHWPAERPGPDLARQTLERLSRANAPATSVRLSVEDAELLDSLVELGRLHRDQGPLPARSSERATALRGLLALLDQVPGEASPSKTLAEQTLARVMDHESQQLTLRQNNLPAMTEPTASSAALLVRRLGSVAAIALVSLSVLLPMLSKSHRDGQILACRDNLREAGHGLTAYSEANDGLLPQNAANTFSLLSRFAGDSTAQSPADGAVPASRINLFVLPKQGYLTTAALACPAADPTARQAGSGYYNAQNVIAGGPIRLDELSAPLLADNNPHYALTGNGLTRVGDLPDDTASPNHGGTGQNVLARDGSVRWIIKPRVHRHDRSDNLWVNDAEPDQSDAFLTP
ncbi:MAG: hypothetical protein AAGH88_11690 [Planctomycetota bacterium]